MGPVYRHRYPIFIGNPDSDFCAFLHPQTFISLFVLTRILVDIWPSVVVHSIEYAYGEGMEAVLKNPNIDAVVPILMFTEDTGVPPLEFVVEFARKYPEKPIYVTFSGDKKYMDQAKAFLEPKGVPTYPMIEAPLEVLSVLTQCRKFLVR